MKPNPHSVILKLLNRRKWYAPYEVRRQLRLKGCKIAPESTTARMRDLRKAPYGRHKLIKRKRKGTGYFEYRIAA